MKLLLNKIDGEIASWEDEADTPRPASNASANWRPDSFVLGEAQVRSAQIKAPRQRWQ